jgi:hypothetical protein
MQAEFYIYSCLAEDVESQRLGGVFIMFLHHLYFGDLDYNRMICRMMASVPIRFTGFHLCYPDTPQFKAARAMALLMMGAANRSRVRFHFGTLS